MIHRLLLPLLALVALQPTVARGQSLERMLYRRAPAILEHCRDQGYKNVGVLKFRMYKDGKLTDRAGTLCLDLADRLEVALILRNDKDKPIGILRNATKTAATIPGATHLNHAGRQKLFFDEEGKPRETFQPSWKTDKSQVAADAFITGILVLGEDRKTITAHLMIFSPTAPKLIRLGEPVVGEITLATLIESGESVSLRGLVLNKNKTGFKTKTMKDLDKHAQEVVAEHKKKPADEHPLKNKADLPIGLEVLYDGQPVPIEFLNGAEARIPTPQLGQKVTMVLTRRDNSHSDKYGIVLKVNGVNTLGEQRLPPEQCRKWVMERFEKPYTIEGFYHNDPNKPSNKFTVLPPDPSVKLEYGNNLGQIQLTVFRTDTAPAKEPKKPGLPDLDQELEDEDLQLVLGGKQPEHPEDLPRSLELLRESLRSQEHRNLILAGEPFNEKLKKVSFPNPGLVGSVTITYYKP